MKKRLIVALGSTAAVALALPAFADHTIAGYARTNFVSELFGEGQNTAINQAKDQQADNVINERIRARWQNNINEYVNVVVFGEIDTDWGQAGKGPGNGGKQGADGVNVEIKQNQRPNFHFRAAIQLGNLERLTPYERDSVPDHFVKDLILGIEVMENTPGLDVGLVGDVSDRGR